MDILTALDNGAVYSPAALQLIVGAWVVSSAFDAKPKIDGKDGDVEEWDYDKQSIYSLLYSLYSSMGVVKSDTGESYQFTFNTWGYEWPERWGDAPVSQTDPQRFGRHAYAGLYRHDRVKELVARREGQVHVVEMGCGTGAGAHHVCKNVLPSCTYEAIDMQEAGIQTCKRKFVHELRGRLVATRADCSKMPIVAQVADLVAVCETHVTEHAGQCTDEDQRFFSIAQKLLKPGGFLVWGNAIPDKTWQPCFDFLDSIGMKVVDAVDVTHEAIIARDRDKARIESYVTQCLETYHGFKIPFIGSKKREQARLALQNFSRHPGTRLYDRMVDGTDTYKVVSIENTR